ncbi:MAG: HEAT repeat protein [Crocinitomicaceae bacterium]|jgi:HEAT repeat protein
MTKEEFKDKLGKLPIVEKWAVIEEADISFFDTDIFNFFVFHLQDSDDKVRFFALYNLIDKFQEKLARPDTELVKLMIKLLADESAPVIDRAASALSIMGESGLNQLIENSTSRDVEFRRIVIWTIGRNSNLNHRKERVIEVLVDGVKDVDEKIRFTSLCALMDVSPLCSFDLREIKDYDFSAIYDLVKPIAKSFMESGNENYVDFGKRYYQLIEKEQTAKGGTAND